MILSLLKGYLMIACHLAYVYWHGKSQSYKCKMQVAKHCVSNESNEGCVRFVYV